MNRSEFQYLADRRLAESQRLFDASLWDGAYWDLPMVKGALVDSYVAAGERLVKLLDEAGVDVTGAMWLHQAESDAWFLLLSSPDVERDGPRKAYQRLQAVFNPHQKELEPLEILDVTWKGPHERPFEQIRGIPVTGSGALARMRFSGIIGDLFVDNALIYRMA